MILYCYLFVKLSVINIFINTFQIYVFIFTVFHILLGFGLDGVIVSGFTFVSEHTAQLMVGSHHR